MKTRAMFSFGLSALVLGGAMLGYSGIGSMATAADKIVTVDAGKAMKQAKEARQALAKRNADKAVRYAEAAVALDPKNSEHRALLGQAYLMAGRFVSARDALNDALTLDPANGKAALNMALAQIATGDWAGARTTLTSHSDTISATDRGLALALAGDPANGVTILADAVRDPNATAKTRQNLALTLALAGRWQEAQAVAAVDVSPADLDKRIMQWATFARPANAYDQVAALLGVMPVEDAGQPAQLALNATTTQVAAVSQPVDPVDAYMPGNGAAAPAISEDASMAVAASEPAVAAPTPAAAPIAAADGAPSPGLSQVSFAPRQEIVQAIPAKAEPAPRVAAAKAPKAAPTAAPAAAPRIAASGGNYVVQLGAYENTGVARDAWNRVSHRVASLAGHKPSGVRVKTAKGEFYRLSVGGFSRNDAVALCGQVKASGGNCFVRTQAGDQTASWAKGQQVASR